MPLDAAIRVAIRPSWSPLQRLIADHYDDLKRRLTHSLGSEELASEALHETYLRLARAGRADSVPRPITYLHRLALGVSRDRARAERRPAETCATLHATGDAPSPCAMVEARLHVEALARVLAEIPERRRAILLAVRLEEIPYRKVAVRFGISRQVVVAELKRALVYCRGRLGEGWPLR